MAKPDYYAHSGNGEPPDGWQLLKAHLDNVAGEARAKASKFGAGGLAYAAGVLHDIGKYSDKFQARLRGAKLRADHSTAGAQLAASQYGPAGTLIAYAIAGHHAGLANGSDSNDAQRSTLKTRLADDTIPPFAAWRQELGLPAPDAMQGPELKFHPNRAVSRERCGFRVGFFVRMLFSCLVDADYLDTEAHYDSIEKRNRERGRWPTLAELKTAFDAHMDEKAGIATPSDVNRLRAEVLSAARTAAAKPPGLFTLTVPTGGGKTLSSLAFALDHAFRHSLDRIIYVIPFTSIIEQTASVFREALGTHAESVIEHHSAFDEDALARKLTELAKSGDLNARDKLKLATENWDAPIIVTTAVQFFESLFAAAPSCCRKLHNIARSVIILDEAQTMPVTLLKPSVAALDELARNYGASVVLCTATQPALIETTDKEASFEGGLPAKEVREIVPEPDRLFAALRRVNVHRIAEPIDDEDLAGRILHSKQALCIVGTRAHGRELFRLIERSEGAFHLSALMCAQHRSERLAEIHAALQYGRPCRVIATTVVEAGVDVDFPIVYRAMAGLDSIAQAAGRCNREGRLDGKGQVFVFEPKNRKTIPEVRVFADTGREVLRRHRDPLSLPAIEDYFQSVYWKLSCGQDDLLDKPGIIAGMNEGVREFSFPFETVERRFRLIESDMRPVIIPYNDKAKAQIAALNEFEQGETSHDQRPREIARKLQRYLVNVPSRSLAELMSAGAVQPIAPRVFGEQFLQLANDHIYFEDIGLDWSDPTFRNSESLML